VEDRRAGGREGYPPPSRMAARVRLFLKSLAEGPLTFGLTAKGGRTPQAVRRPGTGAHFPGASPGIGGSEPWDTRAWRLHVRSVQRSLHPMAPGTSLLVYTALKPDELGRTPSVLHGSRAPSCPHRRSKVDELRALRGPTGDGIRLYGPERPIQAADSSNKEVLVAHGRPLRFTARPRPARGR